MQTLKENLASLRLADAKVVHNLTLVPLVGQDAGLDDYVTLDEAQNDGFVRITEISEQGSVPELELKNEGDRPVMLLDGEELVGAKQNRVLNLTILVPAGSSLRIPVSCVEAGRWSHRSPEFRVDDHAMFSRGRARKAASVTHSMRHRHSRESDQHEVWQSIDDKFERMRSHSSTRAMDDMYKEHRGRLDSFLGGFESLEGQRGAVFLINGRVRGLELFDLASTWNTLAPKLIRSYALDALEEWDESATAGEPVEQAERFMDRVSAAQTSVHPAIGEGEDLRFVDSSVFGGALLARGRMMHLCAFVNPDLEPRRQDPTGSGLASARRRMNGYRH